MFHVKHLERENGDNMGKRILVVYHDNGKEGSCGYSDDFSQNEEQDKKILESYKSNGITVYESFVTYAEE